MSIAVHCSFSDMMLCMAHITTLTLNPSVDVLTTTAQVMDTHKLRCTVPQYHPGGGGINVARVVHRLGGSVQALWLGGGSLPPDAPTNFYADIAQMAQAQQKKLVLDASGPGLEVPVRSTIGAGDTFVGAFVSTLDQMHPDTSPSTLCQALRHAMAASAAALASLGTALCQASEVANLLEAVQVISLED